MYWNNLPSFLEQVTTQTVTTWQHFQPEYFLAKLRSKWKYVTKIWMYFNYFYSALSKIKMKVVTKIWMYFYNVLSKTSPCKVKRGVIFWGGKSGVTTLTWFSTQVSEVISSSLPLLSTTSLEKMIIAECWILG